jgi:hypothetical protein
MNYFSCYGSKKCVEARGLMMNFLKKWVYGEFGLAKTYWLFSVLGGAILYVLTILVQTLAIQFLLITNSSLYSATLVGWSWFTIIYAALSCLAIINSATYKRARGGWGWVATVLAVVGLLSVIGTAGKLSGVFPTSFEDVAESLETENLSLPVRIDEITILDRMGSDHRSKSIIFNYTIEINASDETYFKKTMKESAKSNCAVYSELFSSGAKQVQMLFTQPNSITLKITLNKEDCSQ